MSSEESIGMTERFIVRTNHEVPDVNILSDDARATQTQMKAEDSKKERRTRYKAVALMTATSAFLYADQNLLAPNLSQAALEFGFDEQEKDVKLGGWLQLAFFVVGSPASLIIGWMCDRTDRRVRLFFFDRVDWGRAVFGYVLGEDVLAVVRVTGNDWHSRRWMLAFVVFVMRRFVQS